jgi:hypothetical protein
MAMLKAFAPNGRPIIGTSDLVPGCALAAVFKDSAEAPVAVEFEGETKMYWDGQYQNTDAAGRELYQDDWGGEWPEDDLVFLDPGAHDHAVTIARMAREWREMQAHPAEVPHV